MIDSLRCPASTATAPSASNDACLTEPQIATLLVLRDGLSLPYPLAWNANRYAGYNVFQGTRLTGMLGLAHDPERLPAPTFLANGYLFTQGDSYLRYFVTQDATFNSLNFDLLHPGHYLRQLFALSQTIGAMDTDLSRYIAHGGKLITLQGLADEVISPNQTIAYYEALIDALRHRQGRFVHAALHGARLSARQRRIHSVGGSARRARQLGHARRVAGDA